MTAAGLFITFEGGEGVGKTTQIKHLESFLKKQGHEVVITREPGGTPATEEIRTLLSHPSYGPKWTPQAELMLFFAARAMHIKQVIEPALSKGTIILCDRYIDSTRVYQSYLQGIDIEFIRSLENKIVGEFMPHKTIILDIDTQTSMKRLQERGIRDHYDAADISVHQKLRDGFLDIADKEPERCNVIDADQSEDAIAAQIQAVVMEDIQNAV